MKESLYLLIQRTSIYTQDYTNQLLAWMTHVQNGEMSPYRFMAYMMLANLQVWNDMHFEEEGKGGSSNGTNKYIKETKELVNSGLTQAGYSIEQRLGWWMLHWSVRKTPPKEVDMDKLRAIWSLDKGRTYYEKMRQSTLETVKFCGVYFKLSRPFTVGGDDETIYWTLEVFGWHKENKQHMETLEIPTMGHRQTLVSKNKSIFSNDGSQKDIAQSFVDKLTFALECCAVKWMPAFYRNLINMITA